MFDSLKVPATQTFTSLVVSGKAYMHKYWWRKWHVEPHPQIYDCLTPTQIKANKVIKKMPLVAAYSSHHAPLALLLYRNSKYLYGAQESGIFVKKVLFNWLNIALNRWYFVEAWWCGIGTVDVHVSFSSLRLSAWAHLYSAIYCGGRLWFWFENSSRASQTLSGLVPSIWLLKS